MPASSPPRACVKEPCVPAPFGFWDPLGYFRDGDFHFQALTSLDPAQLTNKLSA